jgi:predicted MFS family arabinose efflux permease
LALGSMISGLAYGAMTLRSPAARRFVVAVLLLAAGTVPFALVTGVVALGVALFVAGLAISPMVVSGFGLVETLVAPSRLTEGLTWLTTTINLGAAAGAATAGAAVDRFGAHRAFLVTVCFGAASALLALAGRTTLSRPGLEAVAAAG